LEIKLEDLQCYDEELVDKLRKDPSANLVLFEEAAKEACSELGLKEVQNIQILIKSNENAISIRNLNSDMVSKMVKVRGIVISVSDINVRATRITARCFSCCSVVTTVVNKPELSNRYDLPMKCKKYVVLIIKLSGATNNIIFVILVE